MGALVFGKRVYMRGTGIFGAVCVLVVCGKKISAGKEKMRLGPQFQRPDLSREVHTLGYILRPRLDPQWPVPMPTDPHRAPKLTLGMWPTQKGQKMTKPKAFPRLQGRTDGNMRRDDEKHRATLNAILQPVRADVAGKSIGVDADTLAARLRKLVQAGMASRLSGALWQITQAGRDALASDTLISLGVRKAPKALPVDDIWALLIGTGRPTSGKRPRTVRFQIDREPLAWRYQA